MNVRTVRTPLAAAVLTAATFAALAGISAPAYAGPSRVQAETGRIDDPNCGDDGPMRVEAGGTGQVVFHPGDGCSQTFASTTNMTIESVNFFVTGHAAPMCGRFTATGAIVGATAIHCVDGSVGGPYADVPFTQTGGTGIGSYTLTWQVTTGPSWINAYVDYHTIAHITVQAESGRIDAPDCGDDGPMRVEPGGTGQVVFHPGDGCSQTFTNTRTGYRLDEVNFLMTGQAALMCGRFLVSGAWIGTSNIVCTDALGGGGYQNAQFTVTGLGIGSYTLTWQVTSGPSWVNAYVDYHTLMKV